MKVPPACAPCCSTSAACWSVPPTKRSARPFRVPAVEQDPLAIWEATRRVVGVALRAARLTLSDVAAIGIATQRATTVVWERSSGAPIHPAMSWQVRTAERVAELLSQGVFTNSMASATKLEWVLREYGGRARAAAGALCFGTVDSWLVWQLSGGRIHVTDQLDASVHGAVRLPRRRLDAAVIDRIGVPLRCCRASRRRAIAMVKPMRASAATPCPWPALPAISRRRCWASSASTAAR